MKYVAALVLLTTVIASGCSTRHANVHVAAAPPTVTAPPSPDHIVESQASRAVQQSVQMFQHLAAVPQDTIPDAVLNAAKCVVVAPAVSGRTVQFFALISCRMNDHWTAPSFIRVTVAGPVSAGSDLLWVVNEAGSNAVLLGGPALKTVRFRAGPLARQSPILSPAEVRAEVLGYVRRGNKLVGSATTILQAQKDEAATQAYCGPVPAGNRPAVDCESQAFVTAVTSYFNLIMPVGILVHHSGVIPVKVASQLREQVLDMIDEFHARRGFEIICFGRVYHVGYHYLILPDGTVQQGRPERCQGAHARGYNSFLGIALVGNFSPHDNTMGLYGPMQPTPAQMRSLVRLCRVLRSRYNIPIQRVMRHSDVTSTSCPGARFPIHVLLRALETRGPA